MNLRSGKIVLSSASNNSSEVFKLRSGRMIVRMKYTPRPYIKRKKNIELRSGRVVSHEPYTKRPYKKTKGIIELRSGRVVANKKYKKRPYIKRAKCDAHINAMMDHYKFNYLAMYSTLLHVTNCDRRKTVDMVREWQANEQRYKEFMAINNPNNYYNSEW